MIRWIDSLSDYITEYLLDRKSIEPPKDNGEIKEIRENVKIVKEEIEKNNFPVDEPVEKKIDHCETL